MVNGKVNVSKGLNRRTFRNTALTLADLMARYPHAADALTNSLAERIREILPPGEFDVKACSGIVNIQGVGQYRGSSSASMPMVLLAQPGDLAETLKEIFISEGETVQDFLTAVRGESWPARGAKPYVCVTQDTIQLWWGGPTEDEAVVKLRPVSRKELGL